MNIINTKADLSAAPKNEYDRFLTRLASGIYRWEWSGTKWNLITDTSQIEKFGFTIDDFPNAPKQSKPKDNPDQTRQQQMEESIEAELQIAAEQTILKDQAAKLRGKEFDAQAYYQNQESLIRAKYEKD